MATKRAKGSEVEPTVSRPATTPEAREHQMIALAVDLAESRIRAGTASAQEIVHFLKLGSSREQLEQERLRNENDLLISKVEQMASQAKIEDMYEKALNAMRSYSGQEPVETTEEFDG